MRIKNNVREDLETGLLFFAVSIIYLPIGSHYLPIGSQTASRSLFCIVYKSIKNVGVAKKIPPPKKKKHMGPNVKKYPPQYKKNIPPLIKIKTVIQTITKMEKSYHIDFSLVEKIFTLENRNNILKHGKPQKG